MWLINTCRLMAEGGGGIENRQDGGKAEDFMHSYTLHASYSRTLYHSEIFNELMHIIIKPIIIRALDTGETRTEGMSIVPFSASRDFLTGLARLQEWPARRAAEWQCNFGLFGAR